jgi:hypothetical protein
LVDVEELGQTMSGSGSGGSKKPAAKAKSKPIVKKAAGAAAAAPAATTATGGSEGVQINRKTEEEDKNAKPKAAPRPMLTPQLSKVC